MLKQKHIKEAQGFIRAGDYVETEGGILIHGAIMARGEYVHTVNGMDEQRDSNLIVTEGINYLLNVGLGGVSQAQLPTWYLAPFTGNYTPVAGETASSFTGQTTELTAYTEAARQEYVEVPSTAGSMTNTASRAAFSITSSVTIYGAGLLSEQTLSSQAGTLLSVVRFTASRALVNGDTFELGYTVTLADDGVP
jgi:hypothetical protein